MAQVNLDQSSASLMKLQAQVKQQKALLNGRQGLDQEQLKTLEYLEKAKEIEDKLQDDQNRLEVMQRMQKELAAQLSKKKTSQDLDNQQDMSRI